jgi:hypothetical protein
MATVFREVVIQIVLHLLLILSHKRSILLNVFAAIGGVVAREL